MRFDSFDYLFLYFCAAFLFWGFRYRMASISISSNSGTKMNSPSGSMENCWLNNSVYSSSKKRFASATVVIPRLANSTGRRLCKVTHKRSMRPWVYGVLTKTRFVPSSCMARPNWARCTFLPTISSSTVSFPVFEERKMIVVIK